MSSVIAAPELITTAAIDLRNTGSTLNAANAAAATRQNTGVLAAAEDDVSAAAQPASASATPATQGSAQARSSSRSSTAAAIACWPAGVGCSPSFWTSPARPR